MKKLLLVFGLLLATTITVNAQEISKNTIGLTFSSSNVTNGLEITYQHKISNRNRLQFDLGKSFKHSQFFITGEYQWVWKIENKLNWFIGPGVGYSNTGDSFLGFANTGIEYNFNIPLLISIETQPIIFNSDDIHFFESIFALSARYQF